MKWVSKNTRGLRGLARARCLGETGCEPKGWALNGGEGIAARVGGKAEEKEYRGKIRKEGKRESRKWHKFDIRSVSYIQWCAHGIHAILQSHSPTERHVLRGLVIRKRKETKREGRKKGGEEW
ncbi:uncharacterized protein PV09_06994 [Verruconis gallopava]|uniref:Uncharacterized protein n=1 Tax=Verruconis gallopava TaxID=253628 RepID=A0A0D1XH48_9PEZI|nr:uncharacterized protein PV09_06994 [Verruconis gallopava]KIW01516.1 hypothetical protein PV09_06994 [Verruconis gallopava]